MHNLVTSAFRINKIAHKTEVAHLNFQNGGRQILI